MAISVFPIASTSAGPSANALTAVAANTVYESGITLVPGIYTITCASGTVATVEFYSDVSTLITTTKTTSGTVTINLASSVDRVRLWTNTGSNIVVTITLTAGALTNRFSGTVETITNSQTYNTASTSGFAYVMVCGGGGAGGYYGANLGGGGGAGGVAFGLISWSVPVSITIGNGGVSNGGSGGTTSLGSIVANGGGGGSNNTVGGGGGTFSGITNGQNGVAGSGTSGGLNPSPYNFFAATNIGVVGKPSTLGAGGGGGSGNGGDGGPGVVYILRF
jgi:hypothetical protein